MNPQDTQTLQDILAKDAENLTPYEVAFINARSTYLNNRQRAEFASVLTPENAKPKLTPQDVLDTPSKTQYTDPQAVKEVQAEKAVDEGNKYANTQGLDDEEI